MEELIVAQFSQKHAGLHPEIAPNDTLFNVKMLNCLIEIFFVFLLVKEMEPGPHGDKQVPRIEIKHWKFLHIPVGCLHSQHVMRNGGGCQCETHMTEELTKSP